MTRTLSISAVLAAIFCRVDEYPWNFVSLLVVAFMSAAIALVWRDEKRPAVTCWNYVPLAVARPALTRRRSWPWIGGVS